MKTRRLIAILGTAAFVAVSAAPPASGADRDCGDFKSRRAAQKFFKNHNPKQDPHGLDSDGDGKACENYDY